MKIQREKRAKKEFFVKTYSISQNVKSRSYVVIGNLKSKMVVSTNFLFLTTLNSQMTDNVTY